MRPALQFEYMPYTSTSSDWFMWPMLQSPVVFVDFLRLKSRGGCTSTVRVGAITLLLRQKSVQHYFQVVCPKNKWVQLINPFLLVEPPNPSLYSLQVNLSSKKGFQLQRRGFGFCFARGSQEGTLGTAWSAGIKPFERDDFGCYSRSDSVWTLPDTPHPHTVYSCMLALGSVPLL